MDKYSDLYPFKFTHRMKELSYLKAALENGLMLRKHDVGLSMRNYTKNHQLFERIHLKLLEKLKCLPLKDTTVLQSKEKLGKIHELLGSLTFKVPMLCFSEVQQDADISVHKKFGDYGLVIRHSWLKEHNADRVIYLGENSAVTQQLIYNIASLKICNLHPHEQVTKDGYSVFLDANVFKDMFDFLAYFEDRDNISEVEWRIVGSHGFMGIPSDNEKRLPIKMGDIEEIFIGDENEISEVELVVNERMEKEQLNDSQKPRISINPKKIT